VITRVGSAKTGHQRPFAFELQGGAGRPERVTVMAKRPFDLWACGIFATLHIFLNRVTLQD
jgi:hypothetical protein